MRLPIQSKFILVAALLLLAFGCNKQPSSAPHVGPQPKVETPESKTPVPVANQSGSGNQSNSNEPKPLQISLRVDGVTQGSGIEPFVDQGKNALEILRAGYTITTKSYSGLGEFVETINGVKPDSKHFWAFYVNGKSSNVGASSYTPKAGDAMEWKLDEIK